MKTCPKCKKTKEFSQFCKDKSRLDGLASWCKLCRHALDEKYRAKNKEKKKEYDKKYGRKRYAENKNEIKEYSRKWKAENKDKRKAQYNNRRARIAGNGGSFTAKEWTNLCDESDNLCLCCGEKKKLTADHVVPIIKGGTSSIDNIQPLCLSCNSSKRTKSTDYRQTQIE